MIRSASVTGDPGMTMLAAGKHTYRNYAVWEYFYDPSAFFLFFLRIML